MSLQPKDVKNYKKIATMGTGTHLAITKDMYYLRNAAKEQILTAQGHPILVVLFQNDKSNIHEQHYPVDNGLGSENFKKLLSAAQVVPSEGNTPKKKDAVNKRLWIAIREIHYIEDDKKVLDMEGNPIIEYFIFRYSPFIETGKRPLIIGDPQDNNGMPLGVFIDYKNFAIPGVQVKNEEPKVPEINKPEDRAPESWDEVPQF